jgi:predicted ATPase
MKLRLDSLEMDFRRSHEKIEFADFTYFYGQMGAGKSSVGRLVDYCFGGILKLRQPFNQNSFRVHFVLP